MGQTWGYGRGRPGGQTEVLKESKGWPESLPLLCPPWPPPHPLCQLVHQPRLLDRAVLQPLNVLLQQQQLVRAQAQLQGSLVRGRGHVSKPISWCGIRPSSSAACQGWACQSVSRRSYSTMPVPSSLLPAIPLLPAPCPPSLFPPTCPSPPPTCPWYLARNFISMRSLRRSSSRSAT